MKEEYTMDGPLPEGLAEAWRQFLFDADGKRRAQVQQDLFAHPLLFPLQRPREMDHMLALAYSLRPRTLLDIGSDKGGGLWAWLNYLPTLKRVICCEIRGTPYSYVFETAWPDVEFLWLPQSSYASETVREVEQFLAGTPDSMDSLIDVAFLDGDKSWFDRDFDRYRHLMSIGGVAIMHDVLDPAPGASFQISRCKGSRSETYINTEDYAELLGRRPATEHDNWLAYWKGTSCGLGIIYI